MRILYTSSGSLPAALVVRKKDAVIDNSLYWMNSTEDEAAYPSAVLNSETARSRAEQYQSRGQFGARHIHKVMFNLPIPLVDARLPLHLAIAAAGQEAEHVAGMVDLVEGEKFQRARRRVRDALAQHGVGTRIEKLVDDLLGPVEPGHAPA